jgi:hypothetical protein
VLGDGRDEVAGLKDLEIAPDLGIESRAVDDRVLIDLNVSGKGMHLKERPSRPSRRFTARFGIPSLILLPASYNKTPRFEGF